MCCYKLTCTILGSFSHQVPEMVVIFRGVGAHLVQWHCPLLESGLQQTWCFLNWSFAIWSLFSLHSLHSSYWINCELEEMVLALTLAGCCWKERSCEGYGDEKRTKNREAEGWDYLRQFCDHSLLLLWGQDSCLLWTIQEMHMVFKAVVGSLKTFT